ncbi:MFS transporter [Bifidobacterium breve]|uniref:Membrane spanning protein MFS superfamily n=3 Tax=Bifidobacterium TaxID=1678 RepID=A0AAN1IFI4_BIFBR|nr:MULTISPECIES: MFS transporter [Bifidobacterium]MBN2923276.1 MFS transporter [Bifidobacterium sp.]AUD89287.1 putative membrane spanning protein MFS superfamily [Bifidobacterium breve]AUD91358.1 putative membrane spanning protein MFS superfamily [Bifidobacterium breve]AUE18790.1 putative membrane spanning protein MFS superfamily [Bifidobacterium breve]MCM0690691.1 MFS transporter [Bifidobacterium sp. M3-N-101]
MSINANPPSSSNPSPGHSANATSASPSLWRARSYRLWFAADTTDVLAVSLRAFVIPLLALQLSGSEFIAGIIVALESAIGLLLLPFGGTLADRHDRGRMMILLGVIGTGLSAIAMALLASRVMNTPMFALCIALFAIMNGLLGPSNDAMLKSIVPMDRFAKAQAIRETRESCVELSSGIIGGFLYTVSAWCPFLVSTILYGIAGVTAGQLSLGHAANEAAKTDSPADAESSASDASVMSEAPIANETIMTSNQHAATHSPNVSFLTHLVEGWRWALTKRVFLSAIMLGAMVNIACVASITGAQIMLAARGTSAVMIGLLGTAMGVSTLVGSLLANKLVDMVPTGKLIAGALALFVVSQVPLLFVQSYAAILICQILAGLPFPALNAGLLGFLYGKTPDNMQGRASAVFETTVGILGAACPAMVGWLLQQPYLGFTAVMAVAVACAVTGLVVSLAGPLRSIPTPERWSEVSL